MSSAPSKPASQYPKRTRVCIVGAGVSGLRAAHLLSIAGFGVTILEARDRIGGRVHQSARFGPLIDLGASWIHGTQDNPLIDLAEKAGSTTVACNAVSSICDSNGVWLSSDKARRYYEEVWELLDLAIKKSKEHGAELDDCVKMMDYFREEVGRRKGLPEKSKTYETLMLQIVEMWGAFMGNDCENQSLKNLWLDAGLEGGTCIPSASDVCHLVDVLSRQLVYGFHIQRHYNRPVKPTEDQCYAKTELRSHKDRVQPQRRHHCEGS